jgi:hypothetical protein
MRELHRIIIHHSASSRSTTLADIRGWHLAKGWIDVAYHFVVEGDGTVRRGREIDQVGAHAKGANSNSIGICVVGNNLDASQRWNAEQRGALRKLIQALFATFGPLEIEGHRWAKGGTTATECPGLRREEFDVLEAQLRA